MRVDFPRWTPARSRRPPSARLARPPVAHWVGPSRTPHTLAHMETSDLLKELRIDRQARAPRRRVSRVLLVAAVLLALAGAGLWLGLARAAPVRCESPRRGGHRGGGRRIRARRQRLRYRAPPGHGVGQDHRQGDGGADRGGHAGRGGAVLARLDDTEAKAQLALAQAQLAAARSQVAEIRASSSRPSGSSAGSRRSSTCRRPWHPHGRSWPPRARRWPRSRPCRSSRPTRSTSARRSSTIGSSSPRRRSTPRARTRRLAGAARRQRPSRSGWRRSPSPSPRRTPRRPWNSRVHSATPCGPSSVASAEGM